MCLLYYVAQQPEDLDALKHACTIQTKSSVQVRKSYFDPFYSVRCWVCGEVLASVWMQISTFDLPVQTATYRCEL